MKLKLLNLRSSAARASFVRGKAAKMGVFDGSGAWFSETVDDKYKLLWKAHGGEMKDAEEANYLFAKSEDAADVREVCHRLGGERELVFLCPRYIIRSVLLGTSGVCMKQHVLGRKPDSPQEDHQQPEDEEKAPPARARPKPSGAMSITDVNCGEFSIHLKPGACPELGEKLCKKFMKGGD